MTTGAEEVTIPTIPARSAKLNQQRPRGVTTFDTPRQRT
jgi:hypothetical protein